MDTNIWGEEVLDSKEYYDDNSVLFNFSSRDEEPPVLDKSLLDLKGIAVEITNSFWCDAQKKKIDVVDYGDDVFIYGVTKNIPANTEIYISIWDFIAFNVISELHKFPVKVLANNTFFVKISLKSNWYMKSPNVDWLFYNVHYFENGKEKHKGFPSKPEEMLKINVVKEIPRIMEFHKWQLATSCQLVWFSGKINIDAKKVKPITYLLKMDWALKFQIAQEVYNGIFEEGLFTIAKWKNDKSKEFIVKQIRKMYEDAIITIPQEIDSVTDYGTFSFDLFRDTFEPLIERYYFRSESKEEDFFNVEWNEYFAAVGSTTMHIAAKGKIKRLENEFEISILQLGVYIVDGFNFIGEQPLGVWNPKTNYMGLDFSKGISVTNATYRDFQKRNMIGMNYNNYSDVKIVNVSFSFSIPLDAL